MNESLNLTFASTATVTDQRLIEGVAVPYDEVTRDGRSPVRFSQGVFGDISDLPLTALYMQHPTATGSRAVRIGRVEEWTDSPEGLNFSARLNDTTEADGIYAALKSGDISEVSVGVYVNDATESEGITTFSSAEILELSVITHGNSAFAGSRILIVHSADQLNEVSATSVPTKTKEIFMENENTNEVADLRSEVEDLNRSFALFAESNQTPVAPVASKFQSFGALVKAISAGDKDAIAEYETFSAGVSADVNIKSTWGKDVIKIIEENRPVTNAFTRAPDPGTNKVEYLTLDANTIAVALQTNELDDLQYGALSLDSEYATMTTLGGYFSWSQQSIDRADINVIDLGYKALASRYAAASELIVRTKLLSATATTVTGFNAASYDSVVDTVITAATALDARGYPVEKIICSPDNFRKLAKLQEGTGGNFILDRTQGAVNIPGVSGSLFGIPLLVLPSGTDVFIFANSQALTIWESGVGRLQDSNVVNLSSQFSLFAYHAVGITVLDALYKATA